MYSRNKAKKYNIAVAGIGYVGLSNAVLLAQNNRVRIVDIIPEKVEAVNNGISPLKDDYIEQYFEEKKLDSNLKIQYDSCRKSLDDFSHKDELKKEFAN